MSICPACGRDRPEGGACPGCGADAPDAAPADDAPETQRTLLDLRRPPAPDDLRGTLFGRPSPLASSPPAPADDEDEARAVGLAPTLDAVPTPGPDADGEAQAGAAPRGTLFGVPAPGGDAAADREAQAPDAPSGTLFGVPAPAGDPAKREADAPDAPSGVLSGVSAPAGERAGSDGEAKTDEAPSGTLFGVPSPTSKGEAGERAPDDEPVDEAPRGTLFGVPSPSSKGEASERAPDDEPIEEAPRGTLFGTPQPMSERAATGGAPTSPKGPPRGTLFGGPAPSSPAETDAASSPPDPPTEVPGSDPAEPKAIPRENTGQRDRRALYHGARYAAAVERERHAARRRRNLRLAAALVLVAGAAALFAMLVVHARRAFRAELSGELRVVRDDGVYRVEVDVRTSAPARLVHPGGTARVDGETRLRFDVDGDGVRVGDNEIEIEAIPESGDPVTLTLHVMVYYRLAAPALDAPVSGRAIEVDVERMPGWQVDIDGGEVESIGPDRDRLRVDPAPLLERIDQLPGKEGTLELNLELTGPEGQTLRFTEALRLPLPVTPVALIGPPHNWRRAVERVEVRGQTHPGAEVRVGDARTVAGADGVFALEVGLPEVGVNELVVVADAARARPGTATVRVTRLDAAQAEAAAETMNARAAAIEGRRAPRYPKLMAALDARRGEALRVRGRLVWARRGDAPGVDHALVATCGASCPYWLETRAPILAAPGARITVVGTLDGQHRYTNPAGDEVRAPRLVEALVLP